MAIYYGCADTVTAGVCQVDEVIEFVKQNRNLNDERIQYLNGKPLIVP